MKRYRVKTTISEQEKDLIRESMGDGHGNLIIENGFDENTLPHKCMIDDQLMHLFE